MKRNISNIGRNSFKCLVNFSKPATARTRRSLSYAAQEEIPQKVLDKRKRLFKRYEHEISFREHSFPTYSESILEEFATKETTPLSLSKLVDTNKNCNETKLLKYSQFLHKELPIRIAQKVVDLSNVPYGMSSLSAIKEVKNMYESTFKQVVTLSEPKRIEDERRFTNHLKEIYEKHSGVLWTLARGVFQLKQLHKKTELTRFCLDSNFPGLEQFLHNFFLSRLDLRLLVGQQIALNEHIEGWVGLFCLETSTKEITNSAIRSATKSCYQHYNVAPSVQVTVVDDEALATFPYIPSFLHHILFELLKNSMRATIETHAITKSATEISSFDFPSIQIELGDGYIDVIDNGGGFKSVEELKRSWSYMYTTASEADCEHLFEELHRSFGRDFDSNEQGLPLAGLGFGLPISKVFAEFLGGSINLIQHEKGTTARFKLHSK